MIKQFVFGFAAISIAFSASAAARMELDESKAGNPKEFYLSMQCAPGDRKVLVQRGKNDNFARGNKEISALSDAVARLDHFKTRTVVGYDATRPNAHFLDHAELPANIKSGYVMLRMRAISGNSNDNIQIGDLASVYNNTNNEQRFAFASRINQLTSKGWLKSGNHYSSRLSNLPLRAPGKTLLDLIGNRGEPSVVDIHVQDDTAVDYVVFGLCVGPKLSWTPWLDRDNPGGKGDYENIAGHLKQGNGCEAPADIQCRVVGGESSADSGEVYHCDTKRGGRCINAEQPDNRCKDYEVRMLCPKP